MKIPPEKPRSVRFGPFEYDPASGDLRRRGHRVRLVGQPRELLHLLIDRAGSVVTREEMRTRLWPDDTFVDFEHSLNSAIKKLRQALRDSATDPHYIETIPRQGYRFVAPLLASSEAVLQPSPQPAPAAEGIPRDVVERPSAVQFSSEPPKRHLWLAAGIAAACVIFAIIAVIAVIALEGRAHHAAPAGGRLTLLVSGEGGLSDPAISPDGSMVAYVRQDKGMGHIYVRRIAGGNPLRVVEEQAREATPAFSPDGEHIAFTRYAAGSNGPQVCTVPALGGQPDCILNGAREPAWSPDGQSLAFVLERPDGRQELAVSRSDGAGVRTILIADGTFPFLETPSWSADSRAIAFVRSMGGVSGEIWLVAAAGGPPRRLANARPGIHLHHPVFEPDGKSIVYLSNRNGSDDLWRRGLAAGSEPVQLTRGPGTEETPSISRSGRVVFISEQSRNALLATQLQTGATTRLLTHSPLLWAPCFAPDGREITFSEAEYNGAWRIWTASIGGDSPHPVTSGDAPQIYDRFSRDGKWLIYFTWVPGASRIWRVPSAGGVAEALTPAGEDDAYGDLSPDGRTLAFASTKLGITRIELMRMTGGPERQLAPPPSTVPRWSPDGKWIAFSPDRTLSGGIFIVHPDGSGLKRLTSIGGWPVWFPGGKRIAFRVIGPDGAEQIHAVSLHGGRIESFPKLAYAGHNDPFDFSPDGKTIVYTHGETFSSEIWMLEPTATESGSR